MRITRLQLILISHLSLALCCFGQQPELISQFTTNDGLPSNMIYDIALDDNGYIWLGTENGLSRFDGREFINFGLEAGLPSLDVLGLYFDSHNRLWLSTLEPYPVYFQEEKVHSLIDSQYIDPNPSAYLVYEREDSIILFNRLGSSMVLSADDLSLITQKHDFSSNEWIKHRIHKCQAKKRYSQLYQGKYIHHDPKYTTFFLKDLESGKSTVFLQQYAHLFESLFVQNIVDPIEDGKRLLIRSNKGLHIFDLSKSNIPHQTILPEHNIFRFAPDNQGNFWVGTKNSGLFKFTRKEDRPFTQSTKVRPFSNNLKGILRTDNEILVYTEFEIQIFDAMGGFLQQFSIPSKNFFERIFKIAYFDNLYYVLTGTTVYQYDPKNNSFKEHINFETLASTQYLKGIRKDIVVKNNKEIFLGYSNIVKIEDDSVTSNLALEGSPRVTSLNLIGDSTLLIGSLKGGFISNLHHPGHTTKLASVSDEPIVFMNMHEDGHVYIVYLNGKVSRLAYKGNELQEIDKVQYDQVNFNDAAIENNQLNVASSKGIFIFSLPELQLLDHKHSINGRANVEVLHNSRIGATHFVATAHELIVFNNDSVGTSLDLKTYIDQIEVNDSIFPQHHDAYTYEQRNINFKYSTPYFGDSKLQFEYQLINHDIQPINTLDTKTYYSDLQPGQYTFKVRARLNEVESSQYTLYSFSIRNPWWQSWWFYSLAALSVIGIAFYFYQDNKKKNKARLSLLQQRLNAIHAQMNPHFLFNGLQSLQYYITTNNTQKAIAYLGSFANLVRKTLDSSAHDFISLEDEVDYLKSYLTLEKEKLDDQLDFKIVLSTEDLLKQIIPSMVLQPFVENAIVHGFQKSSNDHHILISFTKLNDRQIVCAISDNGRGLRPKANDKRAHKSFATKAIKDKLKLLDQLYTGSNSEKSINVEMLDHSETANSIFTTGMTVKLILPIIKETAIRDKK